MRTIFHAAMVGGLISAWSIGLVGCGSSNASQNKMAGGGERMGDNMMASGKMSGDKMSGDKMHGNKMSGDKMATDKMGGDKMNNKMAKDQTP
jgi:pentapeptide MXKDX repeat protein